MGGFIEDVANFPAQLFQQGYQYHSLNAYRSTISLVHKEVDGKPAGQYSLKSRVLKGVFNESLLKLKCQSIWNIHLILEMFRKEGESVTLPPPPRFLLSCKIDMLLP